MADVFSALKLRFSAATMSTRFIYINVAVFVLVKVAALTLILLGISPNVILRYLEMPSAPQQLALYPWTVLTYMFTHYEVLHILFNMLFLYWFGILFMQFFNARQFVGLYILGGLGGAALYFIAYNTLPYFANVQGSMLGASAAILAIVVATAVRAPLYKVRLLLIGAISLKWLAIIVIFLDLISIGSTNAGGHIAHLGGAAIGVLFGIAQKRGNDITHPINAAIDWIVNLFRRNKTKVNISKTHSKNWWRAKAKNRSKTKAQTQAKAENNQQKAPSTKEQKQAESEMDAILDKIKQSGYKALTADEKRRLFEASKKL